MKRLKFWIPLVGFLVLCVVFAIALFRAPDKQFVKSALIDKPMPEFTLPDLMNPGQNVDSTAFKGKWLLVNVWGTWCDECRKENPTLLSIREQDKVLLVGLNYQDQDDAARSWLQQYGNPFDVIAVDREGRAGIDFGVYGAPESFLVNPDGVIVHKVVGAVTPTLWKETLLPMIDGDQT
jgi:cytochrome c biogenesis protein CcmG/thiol:disulfide interchange protein DsbE